MRQGEFIWRRELSRCFIVVLLVFAVGFMNGCSSRTDKESPEAKAGKVTIVYAHPPCPPDLLKIYDRIFEKFRKTHPHINLRVLYITADYESKILTMFAGNTAPDVIFMYPNALPVWSSKNALREIEPFIEKDPDFNLNDYYPGMLRTFTYKGHLYGLPKDASASILYYNKEMFAKEGVEFPNESWTWDDFLEAAKRLTKRDESGGIIQYGAGPYPLFDLIWQNGGRVLSEDGKRCLLDSPEAIEAIQFKADLIRKYRVTPLPPEGEIAGVGSRREFFTMGKMAMHIEMYPAVSILRQTCKFDWDIAPLPSGKVRRGSMVVGSALAITTQSKHPQQAWEWIKWLTGAEGMKDLASVELPSYIPLAKSSWFLDPHTLPRNKQAAVEAMNYVYPPPEHAKWLEIGSIINREIESVWYDKKDVKQVCQELVALYKRDFSTSGERR